MFPKQTSKLIFGKFLSLTMFGLFVILSTVIAIPNVAAVSPAKITILTEKLENFKNESTKFRYQGKLFEIKNIELGVSLDKAKVNSHTSMKTAYIVDKNNIVRVLSRHIPALNQQMNKTTSQNVFNIHDLEKKLLKNVESDFPSIITLSSIDNRMVEKQEVPVLTLEEVEKIPQNNLILRFEDKEWFIHSSDNIRTYLRDVVKPSIDQERRDVVKTFIGSAVPVVQGEARDGRVFDVEKAIKVINESIRMGQFEVTLPVEIQASQIIQDDTVSETPDLLGYGATHFPTSTKGRLDNVDNGSAKFDGLVLEPGEILSAAKIMAPFSIASGYKYTQVILGGKVVSGIGGGACQVSTTLYQAAFFAGLPILARSNHTMRLDEYYGTPGMDAAVWSTGRPDLKFQNDTANKILIRRIFDRKEARLTFEIWGTKDGREVVVDKPIEHSRRKVTVDRHITRTNESGERVTYTETVKSNYSR